MFTNPVMLAQDNVSRSMDEELESTVELFNSMPQTRQRFKKLVCAVATVAAAFVSAALVSASVYRKHAGTPAAREAVVVQDWMKVRVPYEKCAKHFTDCTQSHCCKGTNILLADKCGHGHVPEMVKQGLAGQRARRPEYARPC
mmetsp:Transcript_60575/g.120021  ORF Transcript_60575/g.120021 Transcript_60575/m.120021 type:complete len:143 (+) Transcript_60575:66-494(+)